MNIKNVYASIMTADLKNANKWYSDLLGRKADYHPMDNLYEWDFPNGGVLQVFSDKDGASHSSITLIVDNIEQIKERLAKNKIKIEHQTCTEVANTVTILDPEKNRITFAQNNQGRG